MNMMTKEEAIAKVSADSFQLKYVPAKFKNDRDVVLAALINDGRALIYSSDELTNDKDIVLFAVNQDGRALYYANDELRNARDVVLAAISKEGSALQYASNELQNDMNLVLTALYNDGSTLKHCPNKARIIEPAVIFVQAYGKFLADIDWPIIKKALLEKPDYFLNPEPYMKALTDGMDYPYLMLAQYALSKDADIIPVNYPDLVL